LETLKTLRLTRLALSIFVVLGLACASDALGSGSIQGSVTAAATGGPVGGLSVCAEENFVGGVSSGCTATDTEGHYRIDGLAAGANYQVEFSALGALNYLTQYFHGKEGLGRWDPVTVVDGSTTEAIDAVMNPGAQISGHLTERGSGAAAVGVEVCVLDPAPNPRAEEFERCARSDQAGEYTIRSLPTGTYIVVFAPHRPLSEEVMFAEQYYAQTSDRAAATTLSLTPPQTVSGIDGRLVNTLRTKLLRVPAAHTVTRHAWARVAFRFSAGIPVRGFLCKRDRGSWRSCRSPQSFRLPLGRHTFRVRAVGLTGLKGPIALWRFMIGR